MGYQPTPIQRDSVISRAAQEISRLIDAEKLGVGDPLPPETRLAELLGVSRNSVREALRMLHGLGFVDKAAGKRVVVKALGGSGGGIFDEGMLAEAAPVAHDMRMLVEQKCAGLAAKRADAADLAALERDFAALKDCVNRQDYAGAIRAHEAFHMTLVRAARNPLLAGLFNHARLVDLDAVPAPVRKSFGERRHLEQHRAILRAVREGDAPRASAAVGRHFRTVTPIVEFMAAPAAPKADGARPRRRSGRGVAKAGPGAISTR